MYLYFNNYDLLTKLQQRVIPNLSDCFVCNISSRKLSIQNLNCFGFMNSYSLC